MGYSGVASFIGHAIYNRDTDTLTIVADDSQSPDLVRAIAKSAIWVNGVYLPVVEVDELSIKVSCGPNQELTNGSSLYTTDLKRGRLRVAVEYLGRAVRFVSGPETVARVAITRVDDDLVNITYAAHHEPRDRLGRIVALDGVAFEERRYDRRESESGELLRWMPTSVDKLRKSTLPEPARQGETLFATVGVTFAAVEELDHGHDFTSIARSESEILDLAHSEARVASHDYWKRPKRYWYPTGGVLVDRTSGIVYARFAATDGGILPIALRWLETNPITGPSTDLAIYATAPTSMDNAKTLAALRLLKVKNFFYVVAPRRDILCSDDFKLIDLDPSTTALVAIDRFYRAFIYRDNFGGLPYVTWARALDISLGLEPSFRRAVALPDSAFDVSAARDMVVHLQENAQALLTPDPDDPLKILVTFLHADEVITRETVTARDDSGLSASTHLTETGDSVARKPVSLAVPKTLEQAQDLLRYLDVTHAVIVDSDTQHHWPMLFAQWELVREFAFFALAAKRGVAKTMYLSKVGQRDTGFVYMTARDWHVPFASGGDDDAEKDPQDATTLASAGAEDATFEEIVNSMTEDSVPFRLVCDNDGMWWIVLDVSVDPKASKRAGAVSQKHFEIFAHLAQSATAPTLLHINDKDMAFSACNIFPYDTRLSPGSVLCTAVANSLDMPAVPLVPLQGGCGNLVLVSAWCATDDTKSFWGCLGHAMPAGVTRVLAAPITRDYVMGIDTIKDAYGIETIDLRVREISRIDADVMTPLAKTD